MLLEFFEGVLLPRRVRRRWRPMRRFFRPTWAAWRTLAAAAGTRWRQEVLAACGPLSLVTRFAVRAVLLVVGCGALQWALAPAGPTTLLGQLDFSGVTLLTLGDGAVTAATDAGKVVRVLEAGTGFGYVAVVIGYLPTLCRLFSQREAHVLRLDARAGSRAARGAAAGGGLPLPRGGRRPPARRRAAGVREAPRGARRAVGVGAAALGGGEGGG